MNERLLEAVKNIFSYKTRAFLTMLGIIFGIIAFITMLSIGAGAKEEILRQISSLGLKNLIIKAKTEISEQDLQKAKSVCSPGLCEQDFVYLKSVCPFVDEYSCYSKINKNLLLNNIKVTDEFSLKFIDSNFFRLISFQTVEGAELPCDDPTCRGIMIPEKIRHSYFGNLPAVGSIAFVDREAFAICGVYSPISIDSKISEDKTDLVQSENEVYLPLILKDQFFPAFSSVPEHHVLSGAIIRLKDTDNMEKRKEFISSILKRRHGGIIDFEITAPLELLKKSQKTQEIFNLVMLLIASLSLLIGGIGIMNIMLANVMERTREIGIHRAIGATRKDIIMNFLFESLILSTTGGITGIFLGIMTSWAVMYVTGWKVIINFWGIAAGAFLSVLVGVFFGIYPAYRAAQVDPIEALRYE